MNEPNDRFSFNFYLLFIFHFIPTNVYVAAAGDAADAMRHGTGQ